MELHGSVDIDASAVIGTGTRIWHHSQIRENVVIGSNCTIGRNVYIGPGVIIGNNCKIQNNALIYEPAVLEDGVFIGPGVIFTNDKSPRATNDDGTLKTATDWQPVGVIARQGSSIGAGSICVAPVEIGRSAMVGAGSVVVKNVQDHQTVVGNPSKPLMRSL